jgi:hypothetical protein
MVQSLFALMKSSISSTLQLCGDILTFKLTTSAKCLPQQNIPSTLYFALQSQQQQSIQSFPSVCALVKHCAEQYIPTQKESPKTLIVF